MNPRGFPGLSGPNPDVDPGLTRMRLGSSGALDRALREGFLAWGDHPETRRSHFFGGRFENIYVSPGHLPALAQLLDRVERVVRGQTGYSGPLRRGAWFNAMGPGQCTTLHTHDDDDELVSAVYYLSVPRRSGDLVLRFGGRKTVVRPRIGDLLLFDPRVPHEVTRHRGQGTRLSVAMNFGPGPVSPCARTDRLKPQ